MQTSRSELVRVVVVFVIIVGGTWVWRNVHMHQVESAHALRGQLRSITPEQVLSFKIHPLATYPKDFSRAIEFLSHTSLVTDFLQALRESRAYAPQHDRALAQWGMQITTETGVYRIGCYIPDLNPRIIVGEMSPASSSDYTYFQSEALLNWYYRYKDQWKIWAQHGSFKPNLLHQSPSDVSTFRIASQQTIESERSVIAEFSAEEEKVREFFQAFQDVMYLAVPQESITAEWGIDITFERTSVHLECVVSQDKSSHVAGVLEIDTGYVYFRSDSLYT